MKVEHVHCSRCGARCSGVDPEMGLVVRAYVQCPECLGKDEIGPDGNSCINCDLAFEPKDVRCWYGTHDVGPFCEDCDQTIKRHTGFVAEGN